MSLQLTRQAKLPDRLRLARYLRAPEVGPRVLFFSGGTALAPLSRRLIHYTHNSIHVITPFDSGGSSAKLRRAFKMLAVGDLRNRLMALADQSVTGNPDIVKLFAYRFAVSAGQADLARRLDDMVAGRDSLVAAIPDPMRKLIRNHLDFFQEAMPPDFDLRGASIGNLVLTGGYLNLGRHIDPVIFLFSKLAEVRGTVRPVVNRHAHLVAELADGTRLVGQHLITGRDTPPIASPIQKLYISLSEDGNVEPAQVEIRDKMAELIAQAELICFPMGSFYSSVVANLLPAGVGRAVARADCPKVFIPNTGRDPEAPGMGPDRAVAELLRYLRADAGEDTPAERLLNLVLVDNAQGPYPGGLDQAAIRTQGVEVVDCPLVSEASAPHLDENRLIELILSVV